MSQLKVTTTITDDVYPETTTIDVQVSDGEQIQSMTKHLPKSYFWSHHELAAQSVFEELRRAAMKKELGNEGT